MVQQSKLVIRNIIYNVKRWFSKKCIVLFLISDKDSLNGICTIIQELKKRKITCYMLVIDDHDDSLYKKCKKINKKTFKYKYKNRIIPLSYFKPEYIFYTKPYDGSLPKEYHIRNVSKFYKTCYTVYGIATAQNESVVYDEKFFSYLYFFFAPNRYVWEKVNPSINSIYGKNVISGYTKLDVLNLYKTMKKAPFTVLWNPRWLVYNKRNSNFFKYKDLFIEYFEKNRGAQFIYRPHPLAFEHYIRKRYISIKKLEEYKQKYTGNCKLDYKWTYYESFSDSDVLVSDVSSLLVEYLYTGKPIIFCPGEEKLNLLGQKLLKGFYVANNFLEIEYYLEQLKKGVDPLKETRKELVEEYIVVNSNASAKISSIIKDDYEKGIRNRNE